MSVAQRLRRRPRRNTAHAASCGHPQSRRRPATVPGSGAPM
ncbi:hypothetical protein I553_6535 [Mycobacterium xenopi 4042]|uniref:Uncharacterized protein n=1 Tax=Mycobacterium xenopi 4042 TaxID=1299334 RepID=X8BHY0_MYCXE|nr:hypothetical protein I553_6535 [Mycobacterium xenopi 4042]